jgi:hypothetical protein
MTDAGREDASGPPTTALRRMRVRPSDPTLLPALLAYLRERPDCIARLNGGEDIAVSLLGSREWDEQVRELEERLEPWRARHGGVAVELADCS